ncbi:P-loop containing nucleoside triphosphate hydrolase protein [Gilbertella persicaria]|uniref:P-loop containing nucleoside triphosphate hydrolase protein n=1 Tax=Gilbertella persicaria TaxID=101096 RepID=UPI00221FEF21|nr:P-loop containing nucleoside triphosphate hydrolase protein [Gilbertella persicaria]KAI8076671.1 P-loop containing nucleoside triphosphate hydrolase protein [Gilbertella persicaria]
MLRKILTPSALKLTRASQFTTLRIARPVSFLAKQEIRPRILSDLKIPLFLNTRSLSTQPALEEEATIEPVEEKKRFDAIDAIHANTQKALAKVFQYQEMSTVQEAVLSRLPAQHDMFVKAKTGTGKTLAFLAAALETATAGQSTQDMRHFEGTSIMVISPTRELANQIAEEATKLTSFYPFKVHCLVGGDSKRRQIMQMERRRCDIVVATPGRLQDMLSSVPRFKKMCEHLKVLVLDEADQLLDMGFKAELQRILNQIPQQRQTMLFSATMSDEIRDNLGQFALSPNYELIDTVGEHDVNTNLHVKQSAVVAPYQNQFAVLRDCLQHYAAAQKGKVIVFLPTTKSTMAYAHIFKQLLPHRQIYEIHSKKGQDQRSRIADRFRKSRDSSILFTSDVSARGVDYPGVSLVLQVGIPSSREQYIHRLGRTGRAGREGEGMILLAPFEKTFLDKEVQDLPIERMDPPQVTEEEAHQVNQVAYEAIQSMDTDMVRELYTAYLGYYSGQMATLGQRRTMALTEASKFLSGFGVQEAPYLSPKFLTQLGLNESNNNKSRYGSRNNSFRDADRRRDSFRPRDDGFRSRDNGFRSRDNGFRNKSSGFRDRDDNEFRSSGFRSRDDNEFRSSGFRSRDDNEFKSRDKSRSDFKTRFRDDDFKSRDRFKSNSSESRRFRRD